MFIDKKIVWPNSLVTYFLVVVSLITEIHKNVLHAYLQNAVKATLSIGCSWTKVCIDIRQRWQVTDLTRWLTQLLWDLLSLCPFWNFCIRDWLKDFSDYCFVNWNALTERGSLSKYIFDLLGKTVLPLDYSFLLLFLSMLVVMESEILSMEANKHLQTATPLGVRVLFHHKTS